MNTNYNMHLLLLAFLNGTMFYMLELMIHLWIFMMRFRDAAGSQYAAKLFSLFVIIAENKRIYDVINRQIIVFNRIYTKIFRFVYRVKWKIMTKIKG